MTEKERALLEKELMGLAARMRWDHISESMKDVWRERMNDIHIRLATERTTD